MLDSCHNKGQVLDQPITEANHGCNKVCHSPPYERGEDCGTSVMPKGQQNVLAEARILYASWATPRALSVVVAPTSWELPECRVNLEMLFQNSQMKFSLLRLRMVNQ